MNLQKREDRLLESAKLLEEYSIPYEVFPAIWDAEQPARGLRDTMINLFNDAIEKDYDSVLVLEDDFRMIEPPSEFHSVMDAAVKQLPENYHLFYLGGQPTGGYASVYSANLLPVISYFATQSVCYSKQGMKELIARGLDFPIDNFIVSSLQPDGHCFAVNPILCSQRAGFSDIGGQPMDWHPFIVDRHNQKIGEMKWK